MGAINNTLEQGNVPLTAGEAIAAAFGLAGVLGLIAGLITLNAIVGLVVFIVAIFLVFGIINFVGGREKKKFENQLPDTLTLLSTSLRAGYSLLQAVEAVAAEAPNPTSREFGRAIAEARLGVPVTDAMNGITNRTQSKDFEWAVIAIEIQREVGGNLAEVLQTVADTMLARNRLKGEIKALTAEGRISAIVLGSLPFAMALFLWTSNRDYLRTVLRQRPSVRSQSGWVCCYFAPASSGSARSSISRYRHVRHSVSRRDGLHRNRRAYPLGRVRPSSRYSRRRPIGSRSTGVGEPEPATTNSQNPLLERTLAPVVLRVREGPEPIHPGRVSREHPEEAPVRRHRRHRCQWNRRSQGRSASQWGWC